MAGTFSPQVPGSNIDLSRNSGTVHLPRTRASFYGKPLTKTNGVFAFGDFKSSPELALAEGPSCIFVGPIETASKDMLEALYDQARDSYYSGKPLIVDDMFDKVELKLRCYGSKSVVKYPRCSLRRQSTYADAEYELGFYLWRDAGQEDPSQVLALASIWVLLLAFGSLAFFIPTIHAMNQAYQGAGSFGFSSYGIGSSFEFLATVSGILLTGLGSLIGFPIASASVRALDGLWRNNLVALKGSCPNCGEEVFAFVKAEEPNQPPHKADCHVCECSLEFRTKVEKSMSRPGRRWVYGRIYVV